LPLDDLLEVADDPERHLDQEAVVEEVLDMMMAKLTADEFAAYLLRKGFDYAYVDLAELLRTSVPNVRQLVRRAQGRIESGRRIDVCPQRRAALVGAFLAAARAGDFSELEKQLTSARESSGRMTRRTSSSRPARRPMSAAA
jgi:hypothetical protein